MANQFLNEERITKRFARNHLFEPPGKARGRFHGHERAHQRFRVSGTERVQLDFFDVRGERGELAQTRACFAILVRNEAMSST